MKSNQASIQKISIPLEDNQFLNNTSLLNNYYINLTQNLNLNNFNENKNPNYLINPNLSMLNLYNQNTNENLPKLSLVNLNTFINLNNFISLLQMQESLKSYQELLVNNNGSQKAEKSAEINTKMIGIKRNREEFGNNDSNNNHDKNIKIIINEKNGNYSKKKNLQVIIEKKKLNKKRNVNKAIKTNNNNNTNFNQPFGPTIEIDLRKKDKNEENDLKIYEKEIKNEKKRKRNKKRNRNKELLKDTLLENLDKEKNDISIIINNPENEISPNLLKNEEPSRVKRQKIIKRPKPCISNKYKSKKVKNRRAKTNFSYKRRNKQNNIRYQSTKCIFHGKNYENTNSPSDFMKYNYNFIEEIKQPKKNDDKIKQDLNIKIPNIICENNYENHINNISELKPIWLRSQFKGNDTELNKCINLIKNNLKDGRDDINEEKCLETLMENQNIYLKDN